MKKCVIVGFGLSLMLTACTCCGAHFAGNASTIVYGWSAQGDSADSLHTLVSQQLLLDWSDVITEGLSFHTFVRSLKDFTLADSAEWKRILKIHNLYAQYRVPRRADIRIGRQFLAFGVARGSMDGAAVTLKIPGTGRLVGFAGLGVSGESLAVQSWEDSHILGGHLYVNYLPGTKISTSFVQRTANDTTTEQKMGFDLRFQPYPGFNPFVGANYDIINSTVNEFYVGLFNTSYSRLSTYFNYTYSKPTFAENSYFKNFSSEARNRVRLATTYSPDWIASFTGAYVTTVYNKGPSYYFELSADGDYASLGVGHAFGFGGERSGVFGALNYPILNYVDVNAGVDYAKYGLETEEEVTETEDDLVAYVGGQWRPFEKVKVDVRVEDLINEKYDYDIRFLSSLSVGFGF